MIGAKLGSYALTSHLGEGGMGVVYAAQHVFLGRPAALKVLLPQFSQNPDVVNRFFNEARAAAKARHPGIVEIYDFGYHTDGSAFIAMELLAGQSLSARIAAGSMPLGEALEIGRQIASALQAAHDVGIVHRDLKPDNVFLVVDPELGIRVKLLDFGIAKLAGEGLAANKTQTGALIGTPTYMAPEQCRGVRVDHRVDLYALGCILFELIAGRPPFEGEGAGDLLAAHICSPPPSARAVVPQLPAAVDALLLRLLAKDPAARPQTANQVVDALVVQLGAQRSLSSGPWATAARTVALVPTTLSGAAATHLTPAPAPAPRRRRRVIVVAGVAAIVTALGLTALVVLPARTATAPSPAVATPVPVAPVAVPPATPAPAMPAATPTEDAAVEASPIAATTRMATTGASAAAATAPEVGSPTPRARERPRKATAPAAATRPNGDIVVDELTPPPPVREPVADELDAPSQPRR